MSEIITTIADWAFGRGLIKYAGPVVGPMIIIGEESIKFIDKTFTKDALDSLQLARERNGGCQHILLAWVAQPMFGDTKIPEANAGDRKKTMMLGKRFNYKDTSYLFWHPSIKFQPGCETLIGDVFIGSTETIPARGSRLAVDVAPASGKMTCPFCAKNTLESMDQLNLYIKWDSRKGN